MKKMTALVILDGFGHSEETQGNAIKADGINNISRLLKEYPHTLIEASGEDVGLPDGQMGNSEVGHMNIGAGRIVYQELTRITKSIKDGDFFENPAFLGAVENCIKDMANLLLPYDAYSLIKRLKSEVDVPIHLHTHNTTGTGDMTYLMAMQAGVDIVDCALSPFANGTSQPATESLVATLKGTENDTGLDLGKLAEAAKHFRGVAERMMKEGILDPKVLRVDTNTLVYQVPGGMLSNLISQLKEAGREDKYYDVLEEIPIVRKDFGYPPLVTPTSQIVGTQAVFNVLMGRYKTFPQNSKALLAGEYGALPGDVNEEVRRKAIGDKEVITCRPADLLEPELEKYEKEVKDLGYYEQEEDVLSYALFPKVAPKFFEARKEAKEGKSAAPAAKAAPMDPNKVYSLYVEDKEL